MYASHTKEKLIEKQKSDFFANASHELKTPITVMQGFAKVLMNKEGMDDTPQKHHPKYRWFCQDLCRSSNDF